MGEAAERGGGGAPAGERAHCGRAADARARTQPPLPPPCSEKKRFGSIYEPASLTLSVVVPAYNEEKRIKVMMDSMLEVLAKESKKDKCVARGAVAGGSCWAAQVDVAS